MKFQYSSSYSIFFRKAFQSITENFFEKISYEDLYQVKFRNRGLRFT